MNDVILTVFDKSYSNPDAIEKLINYIYHLDSRKPLPAYCYGVFPPSYDNIKENFYYTYQMQNDRPEQQVWHFTISFESDCKPDFHFADAVAKLFANEYQICYAYHSNTDNPHFHYVVSASSYHYGAAPLDKDKMHFYISQIISLTSLYNVCLREIWKKEVYNV